MNVSPLPPLPTPAVVTSLHHMNNPALLILTAEGSTWADRTLEA